MTTNPTPEPTKPAADIAVEARVKDLMNLVNDYVGDRVGLETMPGHAELEAFERASDRVSAKESGLESALRAALARPQEVAEKWPPSDRDILQDWSDTELDKFGNRDVCAFARKILHDYAASRAPVAVGVEPISLKDHTKAVADFLNELYAIMVDPCATGAMSVKEICDAIVVAALRERERAATAQGPGEAVGVLCVAHHLGDPGMENIEYQPMRTLPPGDHLLFLQAENPKSQAISTTCKKDGAA